MKTAKLRKIGNSTGATFPREVLDAVGLSAGDIVRFQVDDNEIVISKADSNEAKLMEAFDFVNSRYRQTLQQLAK